MSRFEWMVALRYLRAKRKQAVISVITILSVLGVAAGVAALVLTLAINNGFESTLQSGLLSATAHINIVERNPSYGIEHWQQLMPRLKRLPYVIEASPGLYGQVAIRGPLVGTSVTLKGILADPDGQPSPLLRRLKEGSLRPLTNNRLRYEIILGSGLAHSIGVHTGDTVSVLGTQLTPLGLNYSVFRFHVAGVFESGLYELDQTWAFTSLATAQRVLDLTDVVNTIELRLDDIYQAPAVARRAESILGPQLVAGTWMDQNRSLLNALQLEKTVSVITVSLIELVAALNILVVLVMLVLEKQRDIAILMSMGCRRAQIQRIFMIQGFIIGSVGCTLGLLIGYSAAIAGERLHPLQLDAQVYAVNHVPFQPHWTDAIWIAGLALATSLLATLPPSRSAARIAPAEALRYE